MSENLGRIQIEINETEAAQSSVNSAFDNDGNDGNGNGPPSAE